MAQVLRRRLPHGGIQKRVDDFRSQKEELRRSSPIAARASAASPGRRSSGAAPSKAATSPAAGRTRARYLRASPAARTRQATRRPRTCASISSRFRLYSAKRRPSSRREARRGRRRSTRVETRPGRRAREPRSPILHRSPATATSTLAPRVSASADVVYEEMDRRRSPGRDRRSPRRRDLRGGTARPVGASGDLRNDSTFAGSRDRCERGIGTARVGVLTEYITARPRRRADRAPSRRATTWRAARPSSRAAPRHPSRRGLHRRFQYSQARAIDTFELYETAGLLTRWRADPKWRSRPARPRSAHGSAASSRACPSPSHDFVFDMSIRDRAGEGTTISFNRSCWLVGVVWDAGSASLSSSPGCAQGGWALSGTLCGAVSRDRAMHGTARRASRGSRAR